MNGSNKDPNKNDQGALVPLAHQEVRYRAAPTWTRALQWAIVGCIGFGSMSCFSLDYVRKLIVLVRLHCRRTCMLLQGCHGTTHTPRL